MDFFNHFRIVLSYGFHPRVDLSKEKPAVSHRESSKHFPGQRKQTISSRQGNPFKTFVQRKNKEPKQAGARCFFCCLGKSVKLKFSKVSRFRERVEEY